MPLLGVFPCEYPMNFTSPETRMIVLPDTEDHTIISSFLWKKTPERDGWTDRRTDLL